MSWLDSLVLKYRKNAALADLFGIIIYSGADANIKKVLRDEEYWESFDIVSGQHLAVFAVRAAVRTKARDDAMQFMVAVRKEPRENLALMQDLQLSSIEILPALVWLTHDADDLLRCVVPLSDRTESAAYSSIKDALTLAGKAMENVANAADEKTGLKGGNLRNPLGVFAALSFAVDNDRDVKRLKKATKILQVMKDLMDLKP